MKTLLLLICSTACVFADTNEIKFTDKIVTFSTLDKHSFTNVSLIKADLDGVLIRREGFAAVVNFTNIAPDLLEQWKIPTNRIAIAAQRSAAKTRNNQAYWQRVAEQREHFEQEKKDQEARWAVEDFERFVAGAGKEPAELTAQRERVKQLQRENARLWQKYTDGPPPVWTIGGSDDPDVVRARRIASDNALREAEYKLQDMQGR